MLFDMLKHRGGDIILPVIRAMHGAGCFARLYPVKGAVCLYGLHHVTQPCMLNRLSEGLISAHINGRRYHESE